MTILEMETDFGTLIAEYKGGIYIHLYYGTLESTPFDLINVFDYAAGKPSIANKPKPLFRAIKPWLKSQEEPIRIHKARAITKLKVGKR